MNKIKLICLILKLAQSTNLFRNAHLTSKNECYNYCLKNKETFPQLNCFKFLRMGKIFDLWELYNFLKFYDGLTLNFRRWFQLCRQK